MRAATALTMPQAAACWSAMTWSMVLGIRGGPDDLPVGEVELGLAAGGGAQAAPAMAVAVHSAMPSRSQSSMKLSVPNQAWASSCSAVRRRRRFVELDDAGRVMGAGVAAQRARRRLADDDRAFAGDVVAEEGVDGIQRRLGVGLRGVEPVVRLRPGLQHDLALGGADERGRWRGSRRRCPRCR